MNIYIYLSTTNTQRAIEFQASVPAALLVEVVVIKKRNLTGNYSHDDDDDDGRQHEYRRDYGEFFLPRGEVIHPLEIQSFKY